MPVFIVLSGFFAKHSSEKIAFHLLYPYLLFQGLYLLYHNMVLYPEAPELYQFTTPYWALWYLLAMVFYYMLIPLLNQPKIWQCAVVFLLSIAASIIAGFDNEIGFFLTLSRFFTFLPYFVLGYYAGRHNAALNAFLTKPSAASIGTAVLSA